MKIIKALAAAGLLLSSATVATTAQAQGWHGDNGRYDRDYRGDRDWRDHDRRHWDRGRHYGWDRGRHYGWNNHRRCWNEWRHGRSFRVCR